MLNGLDLFSGIGGITLALEPWVRTVAYCEKDRYAQAVLLSRMAEGKLPTAPIWDEVQTLSESILPPIDIIFGGFPCQDISIAGTGKGLAGERSGLFFEIVRLVSELRPRFVFLENVPAITVRGLDRVLLELTALGYDCRWTIVSAAEVGACHLRERWFLLGYSNGVNRELQKSEYSHTNSLSGRTQQISIQGGSHKAKSLRNGDSWDFAWPSERFAKPRVGRTGNGIQRRMDRNKCLGNAVVPIQAREAFKILMGLK